MKKDNSEIEKLIIDITKAHSAGSFKNYVEYIRFPFYKNLEINSNIDFNFPLTVMVGQNGSGKSSALHGIYGMPEGYSPGHFWFSTDVDPIADDENNRHCLIYGYIGADGKMKEVLKTRIGEAKGSHYWEPSRPLKKYEMETLQGSRNPTIKKNVVYLDFRSELSAYDRFFYFSNFRSTKTFKSRQDSIRIKSKHLKKSISNNVERSYYKRKISKPIILSEPELKAINKILGKNYVECKLINHNLYSDVVGLTIYFKTEHINYSEAFAGRGEYAVVKLVHEIMKPETEDYSLILLDEPEVSLHPGAQEKLLEFLLRQTLEKKLQIVLSTHSPTFVQKLPENALKLFYPTNGIRFEIKNKCHYLEAFQYIGENISNTAKKIIFVEDVLTQMLLEKILSDLNNELALMFSINYLPGGADNLYIKAASYSQEGELRKFIILDGDKEKQKLNPKDLTLEESEQLKQLEIKIKEITGLNFNTLRFSIDSNGDSGGNETQKISNAIKYISYLFSNLYYLPEKKIPEDLIWDSDYANKCLDLKQIKGITFNGNNKQNLLNFTEQYIEDINDASYKTCLKLFINEFVRKKGENYLRIVEIFNKFKSISID